MTHPHKLPAHAARECGRRRAAR